MLPFTNRIILDELLIFNRLGFVLFISKTAVGVAVPIPIRSPKLERITFAPFLNHEVELINPSSTGIRFSDELMVKGIVYIPVEFKISCKFLVLFIVRGIEYTPVEFKISCIFFVLFNKLA